jgi:single stranded DNA-binding protein
MKSAQVTGRLGQEVIVETTTGGTSIAKFDLAVDGWDYTNKEKMTDWIPIVVIGKSAEFLSNYAKVGDTIIIDGELRVEKYASKKYVDSEGKGAPMVRTSVSAKMGGVELVSKGAKGDAGNGYEAPAFANKLDGADIPF